MTIFYDVTKALIFDAIHSRLVIMEHEEYTMHRHAVLPDWLDTNEVNESVFEILALFKSKCIQVSSRICSYVYVYMVLYI